MDKINLGKFKLINSLLDFWVDLYNGKFAASQEYDILDMASYAGDSGSENDV